MTVRKVEVADATESLATYIRQAAGSGSPVVVTDDGQPVAALVMLEDIDLETVALSTDPSFLELIQGSRARHSREGGLSSVEVRRRLENAPADPRRAK
jgi:antitoxin (DNA-binding transcriptional repressor) of toxin-antitoxin stability system